MAASSERCGRRGVLRLAERYGDIGQLAPLRLCGERLERVRIDVLGDHPPVRPDQPGEAQSVVALARAEVAHGLAGVQVQPLADLLHLVGAVALAAGAPGGAHDRGDRPLDGGEAGRRRPAARERRLRRIGAEPGRRERQHAR